MDKARTHSAIVWALSVLLTCVFLLAGIPKITGSAPLWLQAAAMRGFPAWIRVVVGVVEVVSAIALLIPGVAIYAALGLALLMIPAAITQQMSGEPGVAIPLVLLVLLLTVAWRRDPVTTRALYRSITAGSHPVLREGIIAGIIGATCVAVWFFFIDLLGGRALFTPTTLGRALVTVVHPSPLGEAPVLYVASYTVFHYVAFACVGVAAAATAAWASEEPAVLLGFAMLFAAFEVGFYGFVALLQHASALGDLAWYQVMIGNIIAALAMGTYIWRAHPKLHDQFIHALDPG
jgi:putative oxidoreductase